MSTWKSSSFPHVSETSPPLLPAMSSCQDWSVGLRVQTQTDQFGLNQQRKHFKCLLAIVSELEYLEYIFTSAVTLLNSSYSQWTGIFVQWCHVASGRLTNLSAYLPEKSLLSLPALILIHLEECCVQRKVVPDWILKRKVIKNVNQILSQSYY